MFGGPYNSGSSAYTATGSLQWIPASPNLPLIGGVGGGNYDMSNFGNVGVNDGFVMGGSGSHNQQSPYSWASSGLRTITTPSTSYALAAAGASFTPSVPMVGVDNQFGVGGRGGKRNTEHPTFVDDEEEMDTYRAPPKMLSIDASAVSKFVVDKDGHLWNEDEEDVWGTLLRTTDAGNNVVTTFVTASSEDAPNSWVMTTTSATSSAAAPELGKKVKIALRRRIPDENGVITPPSTVGDDTRPTWHNFPVRTYSSDDDENWG